MGLFGKTPTKSPREMVQEWGKVLRRESFKLDRQIRGIMREEEKVKKSLREAAKKGDKDVCMILAKEILSARKAVNRIHTSKAQMNSIQLHMKQQLATLRVAGCLEKSADVMKTMSQLVKLPDISAVMMELSKEMTKAGIIEEMMEDIFESFEDSEEIEEAAKNEIDKILWEVTAGQIGKAPEAVSDSLPVSKTAEYDSSLKDEDLNEMQLRLQALRN